jgi:ribose-phosphate pyrophosphokinase
MEGLARSIAACHKEITLGDIAWGRFEDGFPNLRVEEVKGIRNKHIAFLASFDTPGEIFSQLSVIYEIPRFMIQSFKVILPFYPTGTMERVEQEGEIATASSLARMLSSIPNSMSGPTQIVLYDIHSLHERFYFSDSVIPRLETAIPIMQKRIQALEDLAIAFPDEGAWKRFGSMFGENDLIVCQKMRHKEERVVAIKEGDPKGRRVVIVDDLVMTGGTLLQCKNVLLEKGALEVSAFVTHGVFPQHSWSRILDAGFAHFWMTDSCPKTVEEIKAKEPFEVLSLAQTTSDLLVDT